jgi:hypothetical protein
MPGVTYYYIVRAEDTTSDGGSANGGNDDNLAAERPDWALRRRPTSPTIWSPTPRPATPLQHPEAGNWRVLNSPTSHSLTHAWVSLDDQPGLILASKDDRLMLPTMSLTASSTMTFYHNFDFAQFPLADPAEAYQSGGVLEISADGAAWIDLGPYITTGGYNGAIDPAAENPLKGRSAWVGSSDLVPGARTDSMTRSW